MTEKSKLARNNVICFSPADWRRETVNGMMNVMTDYVMTDDVLTDVVMMRSVPGELDDSDLRGIEKTGNHGCRIGRPS